MEEFLLQPVTLFVFILGVLTAMLLTALIYTLIGIEVVRRLNLKIGGCSDGTQRTQPPQGPSLPPIPPQT